MKSISVSSVAYQIDGQPYEGRLAFDPSREDPLPGLLMAPNWMGISKGMHRAAIAGQLPVHTRRIHLVCKRR